MDERGWHRNLPQDVRPNVMYEEYFESVKLPIDMSKPKYVTAEQYKECLFIWFYKRVKPAQRLKILAHLMDTEQFDAADAMAEKAKFLFY